MTIKEQVDNLLRVKQGIESDLVALQEQCEHPHLINKYGGNTGNYDPAADMYWIDHTCPDCKKHWREYR